MKADRKTNRSQITQIHEFKNLPNLRSTYFAITLLLIISITSCFLSKPHYDTIRKEPKLAFLAPPGTIWLRDSVFIDMTEIRNLDYLEFLYWMDKQDPKKYTALLPDTLCWNHRLSLSEPYVDYYFRHPAYRDYPIVGISHEQAVAYCQWRTDRINQFVYVRENRINTDRWDTIKNFTEYYRFRLPSNEEWEYAAAAGLNGNQFPYGYEQIKNKNGLPVSYLYNFYRAYMGDFSLEQPVSTFPASDLMPASVYTGSPNKYGIWNLLGNVSEITSDTTTKGYNYHMRLDGICLDCDSSMQHIPNQETQRIYYRNTYQYKVPRPWIGFRCIAERVN
jgi:formylglycine-generating enzyme required for sulfatase activity